MPSEPVNMMSSIVHAMSRGVVMMVHTSTVRRPVAVVPMLRLGS